MGKASGEIIKVMVAEDVEILRRDFCEMISECPFTELAGAAQNGREIIDLALSCDVDVVLMDIEMERMEDGIEAAKIISEKKPEVRIIFLTVHEDDETVFKAYSISSAKDYIIKSEEKSKILQSIYAAYEEKSMALPSVSSKIHNEFSRLKQNETSMIFFMNILSQITPSEKEIIKLILNNHKTSEIAKLRCVELGTIKSQINRLLKKFNVKHTKQITNLIKQLKLEFLFKD